MSAVSGNLYISKTIPFGSDPLQGSKCQTEQKTEKVWKSCLAFLVIVSAAVCVSPVFTLAAPG